MCQRIPTVRDMGCLLGALGIDFDFAQSDNGVDNLNIKVNDLVYEFSVSVSRVIFES